MPDAGTRRTSAPWEAILLEAALPYLAGRRVWMIGELAADLETCLESWAVAVDRSGNPEAPPEVVLAWIRPGHSGEPIPRMAAEVLPPGGPLLLAELAPTPGFSAEQRRALLARLEPDFEVIDLLSGFEDAGGPSAPRVASVLAAETRSPAAALRATQPCLWLDAAVVDPTPAWLVLARRRTSDLVRNED